MARLAWSGEPAQNIESSRSTMSLSSSASIRNSGAASCPNMPEFEGMDPDPDPDTDPDPDIYKDLVSKVEPEFEKIDAMTPGVSASGTSGCAGSVGSVGSADAGGGSCFDSIPDGQNSSHVSHVSQEVTHHHHRKSDSSCTEHSSALDTTLVTQNAPSASNASSASTASVSAVSKATSDPTTRNFGFILLNKRTCQK